MTIPAELLDKWKALKSHGDGKAILEKNPDLNPQYISRAFTTGECNDEVFKAMADFYQEKDEMVKNYLQPMGETAPLK